MADFDKLLDLLDQGTQRPGDAAYPPERDGAAELCWRCLAAPGEGRAGVCASCREVLLDETYTAPERPGSLDWLTTGLVSPEMLRGGTLTIPAADGTPIPVLIHEATFNFVMPDYDDSGWGPVVTVDVGHHMISDIQRRHRMTRGDFEEAYALRSGIAVERGVELGIFPALPCDCGDDGCQGWRRRYEDDGPA